MFQPNQIADDLKKNGGYIPGCSSRQANCRISGPDHEPSDFCRCHLFDNHRGVASDFNGPDGCACDWQLSFLAAQDLLDYGRRVARHHAPGGDLS